MALRILVTGARGLIGSHVAKNLYKHGYAVIALHAKPSQEKVSVPWDVLVGDLLDDNTLQRLSSMEFDLLVHCAAVLPKQFIGEEAERAAQANLLMDGLIVNLCLKRRCPVVYLSSTSVYGAGNGSMVTEETQLSPMGPYAEAKAESERRVLGELPGRSTVLRISSPYGPGQQTTTVLRLFIERALANLDLMYHGTGNRQQDFVSARDVGNAVLCAVSNSAVSDDFNIASGNPISMRQLAELVVQTVPGTRSRVIASLKPDPQEDYRAAFDIGKARRMLGWRPMVSLEDGIRSWAQHLKESRSR